VLFLRGAPAGESKVWDEVERVCRGEISKFWNRNKNVEGSLRMAKKGLTHLYYGSGKGKTTAALGLALRASGAGLRVVIVQFLKDRPCGELTQLALLPNITVLRGKAGKAFIRGLDEAEREATREIQNANLQRARVLVQRGQCDLLILDEALDACQLGLLDEPILADLICHKPAALELVVTGHRPVDWLIEQADYVTEMVKHKHPYDVGIKARRGIEF
jgi:cob(I)alamin adenosyltransferase